MKIVVIGATGNVGSRTLDTALAAGHEVVAYVRRPEAVTSQKGLTVAQGEAADVAALAAAAKDADAVIVLITGSTKDAHIHAAHPAEGDRRGEAGQRRPTGAGVGVRRG